MSEKIGFAAAVRAEGDFWDLHQGLAVDAFSMTGPAERTQLHERCEYPAYLRYRPRTARLRHLWLAGSDAVRDGERLEQDSA